jgi:hypothetical protein
MSGNAYPKDEEMNRTRFKLVDSEQINSVPISNKQK